MKLYFAGAEFNPPLLEQCGVTRWLIAYPNKKIPIYLAKGIDIFIDSGAFSVFTGKKKIKHQDYIDFIKKYKPKTYASLDVIGKPEETLKNYEEEIRQGLKPIPAFHFGEDEKYLRYYLSKTDFIALGGMVKKPRKQVEIFNQRAWKVIGEVNRKCKVHAFGIWSLNILTRYPYYSADGTTWFAGSQRGSLLPFSHKYTSTTQVNLGFQGDREKINKAINTIGVDIFRYCHHNQTAKEKTFRGNLRNEYNIYAYLKLEKYLTELWKLKGIEWPD